MANLSFLSLFCTLAVLYLSLAVVPSAHALQGMNLTPPTVKRAEHVDLTKRMIKKRQVTPANPADPIPGGSSATTPTTAATTPATTPIIPTTTPTTTPANPGNTTKNGAATTSPTTTSTTSSTSTTSTNSTTSPTTSATSSSTTQSVSSTVRSGTTVLVTQTAAPPLEPASDPSASFLPPSVIIGLIVTGSCLAAGAAIWTIIRKWKFSPSRHFEDRLEPINWEPTQASGLPHDPTVAALERASSRNGGTASGRGSLGSNDEHGTRNMTSVGNDQVSMAPDFPPAHDFTAGAGGGYGGAGYVDMHRGPSPAPAAYGAAHYETPNPYDAYDYNNQYGQRRY